LDVHGAVVHSLRRRGVETQQVAPIVLYLAFTAKGFTVLGETVAISTVARFLTMVGIFGSIYLSMLQNDM